jgi:Na+/citrate or Na+/malate symporter
MLLKPVSILLLLSLLTTSFANLFVFAGFELNQKYIAAELCENKNKPELHCNGKCFLMKKLKQAQDKEQKQERQAQKTQIQDALVVTPMVFKRYALAETKLHIPASTGMPQSIKNSIFHPPQTENTFS